MCVKATHGLHLRLFYTHVVAQGANEFQREARGMDRFLSMALARCLGPQWWQARRIRLAATPKNNDGTWAQRL